MPECFLCGGKADEGDYCYGCEEYVCEDCDIGNAPMGQEHKPEDHGV